MVMKTAYGYLRVSGNSHTNGDGFSRQMADLRTGERSI